MKLNKNMKTLCLVTAACLLLSGTMAYFTDRATIQTDGTAGTVQISFDDNINLLNPDGLDILNPGDVRDVKFSIQNDGNKSVDTEVVITLTSSESMSDNLNGDAWVSPLSLDRPEEDLYNNKVYSSEYELYFADDVIEVEGYGHYPKEGALPVEKRVINGLKTQIAYVLDTEVLSGNSSLDEQELEYIAKSMPIENLTIVKEGKDMSVKYANIDSLLSYDEGYGEGYYIDLAPQDSYPINAILPETFTLDDGTEVTPTYIKMAWEWTDNTVLYVSPSVEYIILYDQAYDESVIMPLDEIIDQGAPFVKYDDYSALAVPETISHYEYTQLSDTEKANWELASDSQSFDLVLLFDPHSSNEFQNSSVSLNVEVRAKQHRNTEAGWELIAEKAHASISTDTFTLDTDGLGRVVITGLAPTVSKYDLVDVVIPEGVEVIPDELFMYFGDIETVTLPSTLKEIAPYAFAYCDSLRTINLPDGLEYIGEYAFASCTNLTFTTKMLPSSLKFVGRYAFFETILPSVVVPEGMEAEPNAFDSEYLTEIVLPDDISNIHEKAFLSWYHLDTNVYTKNGEAIDWNWGVRNVTFLDRESYTG